MTRVVRLSIAPVRSLGLEHPGVIDLTADGVPEDRRFYLVDEGGRLVDRLIVGRLVRVGAHTDPDGSILRLSFPDGSVVEDEVRLGAPVTTPVYDREAVGHIVEGPWSGPLSKHAGRPVSIVRTDRPGGTRRGNAASLVGRGSLDALAAELGVGTLDARRFRMLIELDGTAPHEEDDWIGRQVEIGGAVLAVTARDARCAITTQDPDSGLRDLDTLRGILRYRGPLPGVDGAPKAMFGVLGDVARPGRIRLGDPVRVLA